MSENTQYEEKSRRLELREFRNRLTMSFSLAYLAFCAGVFVFWAVGSGTKTAYNSLGYSVGFDPTYSSFCNSLVIVWMIITVAFIIAYLIMRLPYKS